MVEITSFYRIPCTEPIFKREIYGVQFLCAVDNKEADLNNCYDNEDWDDELNDMVIKHPLPLYTNEKIGEYLKNPKDCGNER